MFMTTAMSQEGPCLAMGIRYDSNLSQSMKAIYRAVFLLSVFCYNALVS